MSQLEINECPSMTDMGIYAPVSRWWRLWCVYVCVQVCVLHSSNQRVCVVCVCVCVRMGKAMYW